MLLHGAIAVIHIDMDAFYASVEIRRRPELACQPVAVGGPARGRGVVAAANYVARQSGVRSAMPMAEAQRRCPGLVRLPVDMPHYMEVSRRIHAIFARYTPEIEPLSLDEAFLDVSASTRLFGSEADIARRIKDDVANELALVASVGVAPTKFVAKIASDVDKPDGFVVVAEDAVQVFLDPLPVSRLWGAGKVTQQALAGLGIGTIGQLRAQPETLLAERFGKLGRHLWALAHGRDPRPVVSDRRARSLSQETTFAEDIDAPAMLATCLAELTEQVAWRLRRQHLHAATVFIKVRFDDFRTVTRSVTLPQPVQDTATLLRAARRLLDTRIELARPVRLLGMGVSGLDDGRGGDRHQADMFATDDAVPAAPGVDEVGDAIKQRFGPAALRRGRALRRPEGGTGHKSKT